MKSHLHLALLPALLTSLGYGACSDSDSDCADDEPLLAVAITDDPMAITNDSDDALFRVIITELPEPWAADRVQFLLPAVETRIDANGQTETVDTLADVLCAHFDVDWDGLVSVGDTFDCTEPDGFRINRTIVGTTQDVEVRLLSEEMSWFYFFSYYDVLHDATAPWFVAN